MRTWLFLGIFIAGLAGCGAVDADDAAPDLLRVLVIDEIGAAGDPDWFEIVNASDQPVALDEYVYVDAAGDLDRAAAFPPVVLAPGARYVQIVDELDSGFRLGSDEELWIYRACDGAASDGVDWADGASPAGGRYQRRPEITGDFITVIGG